MKANYTSLKLAVGAGLSVAAISASAIVAFDYPADLSGTPGLPVNTDRNLATVFSVTKNSGIQVNALGAYDDPVNGVGTFGGTISVAIYQVTLSEGAITGGTLVVDPVSFSTVSPGAVLDGTTTAMKTINPVLLGAGTYMIVANHYGTAQGTEGYYNRSYSPNVPIQPSANDSYGWITYGDEYWGGSSPTWDSNLPGTWTLVSDNWVPRWSAGNMEFTPVPEASHFALAGVGLLGLVYFGRCAYQRRQTA